MEKFIIDVSYSQISVFNSELENPFNDWTDQHALQGFSWREESVSFKTLPIPDGIRAITVPFYIPVGKNLEIATITEGRVVGLAGGIYQLVFETGYSDDLCWSRFTFIPDGSQIPEILIADDEIDSTKKLIMHADRA